MTTREIKEKINRVIQEVPEDCELLEKLAK
jgi:hypothetical protein